MLCFETEKLPQEKLNFKERLVIETKTLLYFEVFLNHQEISNKGDEKFFNHMLIYLARFSHQDKLEALLWYSKLNINFRGVSGYSALIWGARNNNFDIVSLLCKRPDIDISLKNNDGYSARDFANWNNNTSIQKLFKQKEGIIRHSLQKGEWFFIIFPK